MSDGFSIELDDAALIARLNAAVQQLARPRRLMNSIGAIMERNVNLRFDTKTDPNGQPWAPLAPSTRAKYDQEDLTINRRTFEATIKRKGSLLERTGAMRASLTHNAGDDFMEVGFGDFVAQFHETGTARMPDRGLLTANPFTAELGAQDREDVLGEVNRYLGELL